MNGTVRGIEPDPEYLAAPQEERDEYDRAEAEVLSGAELCSLNDGDLITIHWSGELRIVAVRISPSGTALRDLTQEEMDQLAEGEA